MSHAENLLASWQIALQEVGTPSNRSMQLTLGGTANLWDTYLQSALPKLVSSVSNLYVRTEISSSQELTHALLAGRIDIVTVFDPPTNADLESRKVARLELVMVSTQPNLAIEDIPTIGHVFVDWGTVFNMKQAKLFKNPTAPILHTGQSLIALNFLLSHGGAAFLPSNLVAPYIKRGTLHYVLNAEKASQDFYLVHSKKSEKISYLPRIVSILEEFQH